MIRFGIIGAGRIAKVHARSTSQHPHAQLVAISDPVEEAREALAQEYGVKAVADAADIFNDPEIDAVIVCSPTPLHIEHIVAGVKAGKAVLCEKPIAMEVEAAEGIRAQLEGEDARVMLGFNRRFDPNFAKIHTVAQAGELGPVEQVTIISRDPAAPSKDYIKVSGGIFKDMTIHDFDMARFFLGDIATVSATGQNLEEDLKDTGDFDAAVIVLTNRDGKVATIINNRHCATGYDQRLEVSGPEGSAFAENVRPTTVRVSKREHSDALDPYLDFFLERYEAAYYNELDAFIEAVNGQRDFTPGIEDGIVALKIAQAADESARSGKVVEL
ncbi:inositol 2-dehydrogenase [Gleimia hominis]|uniref:inositol 2-dehydrogenase n=1 Tax=Gleimia hominis TaxID=595468 RepID=UPI000C80C289|nr:inositol 2-dehydrogenase [Gleimia hominis]WIK64148.1 inositol 2-dehydrogenase [Gleimia hominis]